MNAEAGARRILIIDEEKPVRLLARIFLERGRYHVLTATSAIAGVMVAQTSRVDLIVCSSPMRGTIKPIKRVRPSLPVAALSDIPLVRDTVTGAKAQLRADLALAKPFRPEDRIAAVESLLRPCRQLNLRARMRAV